MKRFHNIVLLVLIALAGNAFGQETNGWEFDYLHGKVKTYTEFHYTFDISDSINHDEFMMRFYQCGFDIIRMIHFGDSIKSERDHKSCGMKEFDSLGYYTKWSYNNNETYYQNEYDSHDQLLKRIIIDDVDTVDTISFLYDSVGRLIERRYTDYLYQWDYDSDGRLVEYRYTDIILDSVLILEKYEFDKEGVLRKKESFDNREEVNRSEYFEYDSKGNVVFERTYDLGTVEPCFERETSYQYDMNDSIIEEIRRGTRWVTSPVKDTVWKEIDSTGQVVERFGITANHSKVKMESHSVRIITRNDRGVPIREVYEEYESNSSEPRYIIMRNYDELGRIVEEERKGGSYSWSYKKNWEYYKETDLWSYFASYFGEDKDYAFDHESLFFYDDHGNCIAHIQWMPESQLYEYYFSVYRYEYYE
jgi:YD repeat-containing protein